MWGAVPGALSPGLEADAVARGLLLLLRMAPVLLLLVLVMLVLVLLMFLPVLRLPLVCG